MKLGTNQWGNRARIPRNCTVCGKTRMVKPSVIADGKGKYCGLACRAIGIRSHGEASNGKLSPEYLAWASIKTRCLNPADLHYPNYGGRGITICDAWRDNFDAFLAEVGRRPSPKHSIDRINNATGHYEPGNVKWSTKKEQAENRRTSRMVTFNGATHCVSEWARLYGLSQTTLNRRLIRGWPVALALTSPPR